jgi:hypothetical protein
VAPDPGLVRASHLLVKHRDSRRPSSWKVGVGGGHARLGGGGAGHSSSVQEAGVQPSRPR